MIILNDGRNELYQWDTGRELSAYGFDVLHFSNNARGNSIPVEVIDGIAKIPDVLLQSDKPLTVWGFIGTPANGFTKITKVFEVNKKNKPADYFFTPTEQTTLQDIMGKLEKIEQDIADIEVGGGGFLDFVNVTEVGQ